MKYTLIDRLMWHFMQGTCFGVLREECPQWDFHLLRNEAKRRFGEIVMATPSIGSYRENSLKKNLIGGMVWIAIYETANERYGTQMSLPLYEKMCRASISMPLMLKMTRAAKPFTRKFQESKMKQSERENRIDSPYNWQAHYKQGKADEEFTLYYTRCGLCKLACDRGYLDILPAMCKTDYILFEAMGAVLHRDKTLAAGDNCCYYYITKPGSEAERRWQDKHPEGTFTSK
jgi:type I restriction enzyme S subunit